MAPGQVPQQATPWRDSHIFLLSPLMGFLSRAWSRLRGPGPPEPWLVEGVIEVGQTEAGLGGEARAPPATYHALWGKHSQGEGKDSGACEEVEEAANLKTSYSLLAAWGLSDDDNEEDSEEEATSASKEQGSEFPDGQPSTLSPNLLIRTLQGSDKNPGKEKTEEEGVAVDEGVSKFSYPSSHWECFPVVEGKEDGEAVKNEAPRTSLLCPEPKLSTWVYCPGEEEDQATEERRRTESKKAGKTSISSSPSSSNPKASEYCLGKECEEKDEKALKAASDPEPHSSVPPQRSLLKSWEYHHGKYREDEGEDNVGAAEKERGAECPSVSPPSVSLVAWAYQTGEDTEDEENKEEDNDLGEAEASSSISPTSAFVKTWVYRPGEDTEEEDEDSDSESAEEEGEADAPSSTSSTGAFLKFWAHQTGEDSEEEEEEDNDLEAEASSSVSHASAFLKTWVYRPGEDTEEEDEDSDSESAEEKGEADAPSTSSTGAFLKAWVCWPRDDTEDEDENERNEDKRYDSKVAGGEGDSDPHPSLQSHSALLRGWVCRPEEETEEEKAAKNWGEAEPSPFRVAIYLPGEKPPPPWAPPKLPLRLQRRLKFSEPPTWDPDPETPLRGRKVRFSEKVTVHFLAVWAGPAQAARRGPWEQFARDRSRFQRRITQAQKELGPCLTPAARARAWTRLGNPLPALDPILAPTQTLPSFVSSETPSRPCP
ncbi:protein phosphatase 1 regulatory subunit 15A [Nycticebus coucang]|uniref:protein phosphatase 1 regulatory subunit 15A n=1 Tax=Nycticebus coucang TaxID=9470 RepID=UPI00234E16D7|nr:protein phosphatase 1 regulatory subunit 15A [Nycticebus coucang]